MKYKGSQREYIWISNQEIFTMHIINTRTNARFWETKINMRLLPWRNPIQPAKEYCLQLKNTLYMSKIKTMNGFCLLFSLQFSHSVMSDSLDLMDCSRPSLPVHHQLLEFTETHVHWVGDAIQPSHPLPSPSPPTFNLCQHQGLFKWVSSLHQVAKVVEFQLQHQSFQWTPRTDLLQDALVGCFVWCLYNP